MKEKTPNIIPQVYYYTCAMCIYVLMLKCTPPIPPCYPHTPPHHSPLKSPSSLHPPPVCGLHHSVEHQQRASYQLVLFLNTNTEIPKQKYNIKIKILKPISFLRRGSLKVWSQLITQFFHDKVSYWAFSGQIKRPVRIYVCRKFLYYFSYIWYSNSGELRSTLWWDVYREPADTS